MTNDYLVLLGLTLTIELMVVSILAPRDHRWAWLLVGLGLNLSSHPLASLAFGDAGAPWLGVEGAVVAFEALGLRFGLGSAWRDALRVAAWANGSSAAAGLWIAGSV
jgi:hypothetical protein